MVEPVVQRVLVRLHVCFYYNDLTCEVILDTTCAQHEDDNDERFNSLSAIYKVNHTLLSCPRERHTCAVWAVYAQT